MIRPVIVAFVLLALAGPVLAADPPRLPEGVNVRGREASLRALVIHGPDCFEGLASRG